MEKNTHKSRTSIELIQKRISELGINQSELAIRCGEHLQTLSAILHGRRDIPIPLSIRLDAVLGLPPGTIAQAQTRDMVENEMQSMSLTDMLKKKKNILKKIKAAGGLWSYQGIPEHLDDDSIIEAALVHLELEEMPLLFQIWSRAHIKKVWKERLVSQGRRMNILNYILAVKVFEVNKPDNYLSRYAY